MSSRTTVLAAFLLSSCGEQAPPSPAPAPAPPSSSASGASPGPVDAAPADAASAPAQLPAGRPEHVPDYHETPACPSTGGDGRALKRRLAQLERKPELPPPTAASLTEGCLVPRATIARSLTRASQQLGRKKAWRDAASYAALAVEVDPASPDARMALAVARTQLGELAGAIHQLEQWRAARKADEDLLTELLRERGLEPLRARRAFWTWANQPPPKLVTSLREEPGASPLRMAAGATIEFPRAIGSTEDLIYEPVRLSAAERRAIAQAISETVGRPFFDYQYVVADELLGPISGTSLISGAYLFRFTPETRLLAVSLSGWFKGDGTEVRDADAIVSVVAVEQAPGKYVVVELLCSRLGCHCRDSALRVTRDRRALAWIEECPDSDDPATWERCVVYADAGQLVKRCELLAANSDEGGGEMWRSCTAGELDFDEEEGAP